MKREMSRKRRIKDDAELSTEQNLTFTSRGGPGWWTREKLHSGTSAFDSSFGGTPSGPT